MANKKKVLFINFGGLGDEILFLPTIQAVKNQYPDTEITLAMEERSKGILDLTNCIDKAYFADIKAIKFKPTPFERLNKILHFLYKINELTKLLFKIWGENYNLAISSGGNKLISIFLFCTLIPKRIGYNTGKLSEKILTRAVDLNKNQYAVNMYHDLVKPLINAAPKLPELSIQKKPTIQNSVLIHPGVSKLSIQKGIIKTIRPSQWAELVEKLSDKGKKVFLVGGPDDKDCIETIVKSVPNEKFENLYGRTQNVRELAELISSTEKFICSDSAPLHIAVALGVKTYVIFGSTDSDKLIPKSENVIPIQNSCNCPIKPCLWEKRQTTCEELSCLKFYTDDIIETILSK